MARETRAVCHPAESSSSLGLCGRCAARLRRAGLLSRGFARCELAALALHRDRAPTEAIAAALGATLVDAHDWLLDPIAGYFGEPTRAPEPRPRRPKTPRAPAKKLADSIVHRHETCARHEIAEMRARLERDAEERWSRAATANARVR